MNVTKGQAELCMSFLMDQDASGEDWSAPLPVIDAVHWYGDAIGNGDQRAAEFAVEELRVQIERWLRMAPNDCASLLGPGLGLEQS